VINNQTHPNGVSINEIGDAGGCCQSDYCADEHVDLGGGECRRCKAARAGYRVCGYCGFLWTGAPRVCRAGSAS
jgi:hypothetical protein